MTEKNRDFFLRETSQDTLDCIEAVANDAEKELTSSRRSGAETFAAINTFTSGQQVQNLSAIASDERRALQVLLAQPIIAQVQYRDENDEPGVIYITRDQPRPIRGFKITSRNSLWGRLAALAPGDDETIITPSGERDLLIDAKVIVSPKKIEGQWDAKNAEFSSQDFGNITVLSLRALLGDDIAFDDSELDPAWSDGEEDENVIEGLRRAIITHMGLRDQPILDKHQDEIFRLPINSRCFLSGPPGTGKTTTLIRRLGQKTDLMALDEAPDERILVDRVDTDSVRSHASNWIMFSPTELLRQYVKEAFAREGQAASDDHIRTWEEFRLEIARDHLGLLKTSAGGGPFIVRPRANHLLPDTRHCTRWYDDFEQYFTDAVVSELTKNVSDLRASKDPALVDVAQQLDARIAPLLEGIQGIDVFAFREVQATVAELVASRRNETNRIFTRLQNMLVHNDRTFPAKLRGEISRIERELTQDDAEDDDAELSFDEDDEMEVPVGRNVSRALAVRRLRGAIQALALAKARKRSVTTTSRNGMIIAWLGQDRLPSDNDIASLGTLILEQRTLQRFVSIERVIQRAITREYRAFRRVRAEEGIWYNKVPEKSSDLHWQELDLLSLTSLRLAGRLLDGYRRSPAIDLPDSGVLGAVRGLYRAQILVDEATDFSPVQLACMYELSHPSMRSFFICGDVNQRLTSWGLKSAGDLAWIDPSIETKKITVSYRQSEKLVDLAKSIAAIDKVSIADTILPERVDIAGVSPVWALRLEGYDRISEWLFSRIQEIDAMVREATTIAVLVNSEEHVGPLAEALNTRLEDISLAAVACREGRDVGNDRDVRVFDIRHIKGLEFEGVFFVGLDETIKMLPELYTKYLYVGATRAATYLGVTFAGDLPDEVTALEPHFIENWSG